MFLDFLSCFIVGPVFITLTRTLWAHHIDRPWHVTRCCAACAPVLDDDDWPSDAMSRCRWWHHRSTSFSSSSTNWFPDVITRHVFLVEHELISRYHQTSLDTFSSSSTNWFHDVITRHVFLVEHELISWLYHQTSLDTFSSSSTNFETKSTSLFKGLVDPRSSSFACDVHLLPGPGPALTSAAISDKFVVAFLSYNFWTSPRNRRTFPGCGLHPLRTTTTWK